MLHRHFYGALFALAATVGVAACDSEPDEVEIELEEGGAPVYDAPTGAVGPGTGSDVTVPVDSTLIVPEMDDTMGPDGATGASGSTGPEAVR